jgi:hypothetical protein
VVSVSCSGSSLLGVTQAAKTSKLLVKAHTGSSAHLGIGKEQVVSEHLQEGSRFGSLLSIIDVGI